MESPKYYLVFTAIISGHVTNFLHHFFSMYIYLQLFTLFTINQVKYSPLSDSKLQRIPINRFPTKIQIINNICFKTHSKPQLLKKENNQIFSTKNTTNYNSQGKVEKI